MNPEQLYNIGNIEELAVGLNGANKSESTDNEPDVFPHEAFTGVFYRWMDQMREVTDAPVEYLWGALLLAISQFLCPILGPLRQLAKINRSILGSTSS
jgi:hypothetical protein